MNQSSPTEINNQILQNAIEAIASIFVALIDHKEIIKVNNKTNDQESK